MTESLRGKKILILGCGTWQVPYIQRAAELGMKVYATDWAEEPEGKKFAHVFAQIDLRDAEKSLEFAQTHAIEAIFTSADIGVQTAAFIAHKMGLPYHSTEVAFWATNKNAMRIRAREVGLGIPEFKVVNQLDGAIKSAAGIGYPVIVKPVDSASSRGVSVIYEQMELETFFPVSQAASFSGEVLIEEFMIGVEGSVEAIVVDGEPFIMGVCDKIKSPLPFRYDLQLNYPGNYNPQQWMAIEEFIVNLVKGFKIIQGIIHVEIMVTDHKIRLIEFAIRGCGSKVITHLMPKIREFDVVTWLLALSFGLKLPVQINKSKVGILKFIMLNPGIIEKINGIEKARSIPGIIDCDIERKPGDAIGEIMDGRSRPGYLIAFSDTKQELNAIVEEALQNIEVTYAA